MNDYVYYFIRKDLSKPQQIIQTAHAAAQIGEKYHSDTYAALCEANDEEHLKSIAEYLDTKDIDFSLFFEPAVNEYTALATKPLKGSERNPLRKFSLMP